MPTIQKNDIVSLADCSSGHVLEVIPTNNFDVYKIQKSNHEIVYVDGSMIRLKKQCRVNFFICALKESFQFLLHALRL
jgi:hypothetical protein